VVPGGRARHGGDGAELLFYPTAIGSEPQDPRLDSRDHWRRAMQGHAASNCMPVIASNRIGREVGESCAITFYGSSFITDATGGITAELGEEPGLVTASFDLDELARTRAAWGLFRDRRPDLYLPLLTLDGRDAGI
jgi:N-carbamoylputrescine amidase